MLFYFFPLEVTGAAQKNWAATLSYCQNPKSQRILKENRSNIWIFNIFFPIISESI